MKKKTTFGLNVGASSILVIVVILCLVCFAGLSVASANADYQLSLKLANRTSDYYEACSQAHRALNAEKKEFSEENPFQYSYPINDNQELRVEASLDPEADSYHILKWQIVTVHEPEMDQSLTLLLGN